MVWRSFRFYDKAAVKQYQNTDFDEETKITTELNTLVAPNKIFIIYRTEIELCFELDPRRYIF